MCRRQRRLDCLLVVWSCETRQALVSGVCKHSSQEQVPTLCHNPQEPIPCAPLLLACPVVKNPHSKFHQALQQPYRTQKGLCILLVAVLRSAKVVGLVARVESLHNATPFSPKIVRMLDHPHRASTRQNHPANGCLAMTDYYSRK